MIGTVAAVIVIFVLLGILTLGAALYLSVREDP